jgi:hypothetical protein
MTFLCRMAQSVTPLALARICVGIGYSLLSTAVTTSLGALLFVWAARFIRADIKRAVWCPLSEVRAPSPRHLFGDFGKLWALANP